MADEDKDNPTPTPTPTVTRTEDHVDPDELRRVREALAKANKEAEAHRKEARELREAEEQRKSGELSELERTKKATAAAEKARVEAEEKAAHAVRLLADTRINHAIERTAAAMDPPFRYPHIVPSLVNRSKIGYDAEAEVVDKASVTKELDRLAKEMPDLLRAPAGRGSPNRDGAPPRPANAGVRGGNNRGKDEEEPDLYSELHNEGGYSV
jgi:hypothetical protein